MAIVHSDPRELIVGEGRSVIGYPLLLQPRFDEKIWGGRRLETVLNKPLPSRDALVGESLESGDDATVTNGPLAGMTLRDIVAREPDALLGEYGQTASSPFGDFPLLVKFIDASATLSLQVHPNDDEAASLNKRGKTEAWHVVAADPGAFLITGLTRDASPDEVRQAIEGGTFESLIERREVQPGDTLFVPAGTIHAIGSGILLYEVQENSDVTYRLYDWGRVDDSGNPRDLHLDESLEVMRQQAHAALIHPLPLDEHRDVLTACRYFALERWAITGEWALPHNAGRTLRLLSCIAGSGVLQAEGTEPLPISTGQTVLLPADLPSAHLTGEMTLLCSSVPDLVADIAGPLLQVGHSPGQIALLDGGTGDLMAALQKGNLSPQA